MTFAQQLENRGLEKGIYRTNRQNAQKMLLEGLSLSTISRITGLSEKEIKMLVAH